MGILDFIRKKKAPSKVIQKKIIKSVEHAEEIEHAIKIIKKNPLMKHTYDHNLLESIKTTHEQIIVNQQLILDSVTIRDKEKGEIGLSDYLVSGEFLKNAEGAFKKAIGISAEQFSVTAQSKETIEPKISKQLNELKELVIKLEEKIKLGEKQRGISSSEKGEKKESILDLKVSREQEQKIIELTKQLDSLREELNLKEQIESQLREKLTQSQEEIAKIPAVKRKKEEVVKVKEISKTKIDKISVWLFF